MTDVLIEERDTREGEDAGPQDGTETRGRNSGDDGGRGWRGGGNTQRPGAEG